VITLPETGHEIEQKLKNYQHCDELENGVFWASENAKKGDVVLLARELAREKGVPFLEVHVNAPIEVCEKRDPKGLYAKARRGEIAQFTGISSPYEAPENPELSLKTAELNVEACVTAVIDTLMPAIRIKG
jgi:hypothetical protein